jgi:hypothetical protein
MTDPHAADQRMQAAIAEARALPGSFFQLLDKCCVIAWSWSVPDR